MGCFFHVPSRGRGDEGIVKCNWPSPCNYQQYCIKWESKYYFTLYRSRYSIPISAYGCSIWLPYTSPLYLPTGWYACLSKLRKKIRKICHRSVFSIQLTVTSIYTTLCFVSYRDRSSLGTNSTIVRPLKYYACPWQMILTIITWSWTYQEAGQKCREPFCFFTVATFYLSPLLHQSTIQFAVMLIAAIYNYYAVRCFPYLCWLIAVSYSSPHWMARIT